MPGVEARARDSESGVNDLPGWNRPVIRVARGGVLAVESREHADGGTSCARCRLGVDVTAGRDGDIPASGCTAWSRSRDSTDPQTETALPDDPLPEVSV